MIKTSEYFAFQQCKHIQEGRRNAITAGGGGDNPDKPMVWYFILLLFVPLEENTENVYVQIPHMT